MTFQEKLKQNKNAYFVAKEENRNLNIEVSTRNNTRNIIVTEYDFDSPPISPNKRIKDQP